MLENLGKGRVFINFGPIQMMITSYIDKAEADEISMEAGLKIIDEFKQLYPFIPNLKTMRFYNKPKKSYPRVLNKMIDAVEKSGYEELNTLGAVAGSFADIALEYALELGATRVIVNNGGDIALRDLKGSPVKVGIPYSHGKAKRQLILSIVDKEGIYGICTSGMGGRSFTKGIATAAVVLAGNGAIADACATYIGNMTNIEDKSIIRSRAEEIDSKTDIKGQLITLKIGDLDQRKKHLALLNGLKVAEDLYVKGTIKGCIIIIEDIIVKYPDSLNIEIQKL